MSKQKHKEDEIIIDISPSPKTMAFGAYDTAREFKQQGLNIEICYFTPQGLVWVFREPHEPESIKIGLKQYFNSYGWNVSCKNHNVTDNFRAFVQFMVDKLPMSFLTAFRKNSQGKDKKTHKCPTKEINDDYYSILCKFKELGFISNLQRDNQSTCWTIDSNEDRKLLTGGHWLEYYVYKIASALTDSKGKLIFDECGWGVEDNAKKGEIDFVGIFGGQLIIASCKTEESIKKEWFQELSYKTEQLGKGMCSALLISTVSRASRKEHELEEYNRWAKGAQVVLVMQEDLAQLPEILLRIKEKPDYPRI